MLSEQPWFTGVYRRVYEILAKEGRLPPADKIRVAENPRELGVEHVPETVMAFAVREPPSLWFRHSPPDIVSFAHELIHLAKKGASPREEEIFGYNLASFVALLATRGIDPPTNPLRLFEDVDEKMLLRAIREAYGYPFPSLEDYFAFIGVIPGFVEFKTGPTGVTFKRAPGVTERQVVINAVSELVAGAEWSPPMLKVLLTLLRRLKP